MIIKADQNMLQHQEGNNYNALHVKTTLMAQENAYLRQTLTDYQSHIESMRAINTQLGNSLSLPLLIQQLTKQNSQLQLSLRKQVRLYQSLSSDFLIKSQLMIQSQHEVQSILSNYQSKIYQLRTNLQTKQAAYTYIEDKINQQKDLYYDVVKKSNLVEFGELVEIRKIVQKYQEENMELRKKCQEKDMLIEKGKKQLENCEAIIKDKTEWEQYQSTNITFGNSNHQNQSKKPSKSDPNMRSPPKDKYYRKQQLLIQQYRMLIHKLRLDLQNSQNIQRQLYSTISIKQSQLKILRQGYSLLQRQLFNVKIQCQFYRQYFKELSKITAEQKIKFYRQVYKEQVNALKGGKSKEDIIRYWKDVGRQFIEGYHEKMTLFGKSSTSKRTKIRRSNSCNIIFKHKLQKSIRPLCPIQKQEAIMSFINLDQGMHSMVSCTFDYNQDESRFIVNGNKEDYVQFQDQFSIICKPEKNGHKQ